MYGNVYLSSPVSSGTNYSLGIETVKGQIWGENIFHNDFPNYVFYWESNNKEGMNVVIFLSVITHHCKNQHTWDLRCLHCFQANWSQSTPLAQRVESCMAFRKKVRVYLHYRVSCWVLWWPVLLFGVLCLPSRQFNCYLCSARLTLESYK